MHDPTPEQLPKPTPGRTVLAVPEEVADFLRITTEKLSKMRSEGTGPRFLRVGRDIRYAWPDVHRWLDQNRREKASERVTTDPAPDLVTIAQEAAQTTAKPTKARAAS